MQVLRWATVLVLLLAVASCTSDNEQQNAFPVGIWQGTYQGQPISIEFREDGRAILIYGGEDAIGLAAYCIDPQQQPGHLDIEFRYPHPPWRPTRTLIEQLGTNAIRIQHLKGGTPRPAAFTSEAVFLRRARAHVLPQGTTSAKQRDKALQHALTMDMIWFGGEGHAQLLAICETVFRYQFTHNASAVQQKAAAYYLSIDQRDPPGALLARFQSHSPPVKPGSEFRESNGLKFRIDSLILLDEITVEAKGGYYEGNVSASGGTYRLRRQDGTWKVIAEKPGWIS